MAGNAQAAASSGAPSRGNFLQQTLRNRSQLPDVSYTAQGDNKSVDVFATGYAAYLRVMVYGKIITGTSSAGTWDANFWPWNLMKRLQLTSNAGFTFYDTDGFTNRLVQTWQALGYDPGLQISPNVAAPYSTTGARVANVQFPTGALADSTTYPILVEYLIPIVAHKSLRAGLLPLQNNATRVTLRAVLGSITDWAGSSGVIGTGGSVSFTMRTEMEWYSVPADPSAQPDISYIHRVIQDTQSWTTSGDQDYKVPVNGVIMRVQERFINAGVPEKFFTTANDPTTNRFGNCAVIYAASEQPENSDFRFLLQRHRQQYLTDSLDGCILFDFADGSGSPENALMSTNMYNTQSLTEFKLRVNVANAPGSNSTIEVIREELQPRVIS